MITTWHIDPIHSSAKFNIIHLLVDKVYGSFEKISGTLTLDLDDPLKSSAEAIIESNSVDTHNEERDEQIKSADFLNAKKFPNMTFKSTSVSEMQIKGILTIHGVSAEVELSLDRLGEELRDQDGFQRIRFSASSELKLSEFELTWNTALKNGGFLVGDKVKVILNIQFIKD